MAFANPGFLPLLLLLPAFAALYFWSLRRRRRYGLNYSSVSLLQGATSPRSTWRRHVPPALFGLTVLALAVFSGYALELIPPTEDRKQVEAAVSVLELSRGTNIGDGLRMSLETLMPGSTQDPEGPYTIKGVRVPLGDRGAGISSPASA